MPQTIAEPYTEQCHTAGNQRSEMVADFFTGRGCQVLHALRSRDRIENVILEPRAKRNMPAHPEFGNGFREKGPPEVFGHGNAENLRNTYDRIHRTRKVHV